MDCSFFLSFIVKLLRKGQCPSLRIYFLTGSWASSKLPTLSFKCFLARIFTSKLFRTLMEFILPFFQKRKKSSEEFASNFLDTYPVKLPGQTSLAITRKLWYLPSSAKWEVSKLKLSALLPWFHCQRGMQMLCMCNVHAFTVTTETHS